MPDDDHPKVAVIGFGYVGSCIAATLTSLGCEVIGVDTDPLLVAELERGYCRFHERGLAETLSAERMSGRLRVTADMTAVGEADVVLVTVGTPVHEDGSLADEQLSGACRELGDQLGRGQLVIVKSTVPPGTTRRVVCPLLERSGMTAEIDFGLAFTPERIAEGTALHELRTFPIVTGGIGPHSARAAEAFWARCLGVEVNVLASLESAEMLKLATNWWIDLNIAFANELAKVCAPHDVDVLDVIDAANTIPKGNGKVNILHPSVGVGGSCLTKDPWMISHSAKEHGIVLRTASTGREINAAMPEHTAQLAVDELLAMGKEPAECKVAVLGLAFKNNTGDLRATPTGDFVKAVRKAGANVAVFDPLADPEQVKELFGIAASIDLDRAVRDADCIAILALHNEFEHIEFAELNVRDSCVVLDGRAYYSSEKIAELRGMGYVYRGVGR
ncbi:nucleotide sugar dehydrogenase [Actinopolyspora mzabensis]|uniref:nucleotide sugar dehydrogenase n=1 Tax=Actinopolyspora mzabensis TaxID=995066 RepID=UPI0015A4B6CE